MDRRYRHPMYTSKDEELALDALVEYTQNNNKSEQIALQGKFIYEQPTIPKEIVKTMIGTQYGRNLITIANYLNTQDIFFSQYMPHWLSYLNALGINASCILMRPSSFTMKYIIKQVIAGNMDPLTQWNPDIFWTNYTYGSDTTKNLANPLNNFYRATLHIHQCDNFDFISALNEYHGVVIKGSLEKTYNLDINILPAPTPFNMVEITKLIHEYL